MESETLSGVPDIKEEEIHIDEEGTWRAARDQAQEKGRRKKKKRKKKKKKKIEK
jgi:hypothetical protein